MLPFGTRRPVMIVPRSHPWSNRKSVRIGEVSKERVISRETRSATRRIFDDALKQGGGRSGSVMQIESREAVREAAAAGLHLGVVSESGSDTDRRLKTLRFSDVHLETTEYVVRLQDRRRLSIVRAFLELAEAMARDG